MDAKDLVRNAVILIETAGAPSLTRNIIFLARNKSSAGDPWLVSDFNKERDNYAYFCSLVQPRLPGTITIRSSNQHSLNVSTNKKT